MRPGPLEIILIIAIIIAVVILARIFRGSRRTAEEEDETTTDVTVRMSQTNPRLYSLLNKTGIAFIISGIIALIAALSIFRWAFQSYLWAVLVIAIGFIIVFLSRKKR